MTIKHEIVQTTPKLPFKYYFHDGKDIKHVPPHWHQSLELGFLVSDNVLKIRDNNATFTYHKGDIWLINSRDIHEAQFESVKNVFEFCLLIDYDFLKQIYPNIDQIHFSLHGRPAQLSQLIPYQEIEKQLRIMIQLLQEPKTDSNNLNLTGHLYILIALFLKNFSRQITSDTLVNESLIDKALSTINTNYAENLNGTILAKRLNTSVTTLNLQFHQAVQMPINKYITTVRLLMAQKKLLNTDRNIDCIAIECGFSSTKSFVRNFKNWKGTTPFQYRKNYV